jgi:DNA-binding NarL/FixJ family response regulator
VAIRILLVDGHELLREGIKSVLGREPDLAVVGEAGDGNTALERCRALAPDLVLLDARLPDMDGLEVLRLIQREAPGTRTLMLASCSDAETVVAAVQAGAMGYLLKDVPAAELLRSIRAMARGQVVVDPRVVGHLVRQMRAIEQEHAGESKGLNRQQKAIIRLVARGCTNREIAAQLYLSEKTVKGYLAEALRRMGVKNRVEAAMAASRQGWI